MRGDRTYRGAEETIFWSHLERSLLHNHNHRETEITITGHPVTMSLVLACVLFKGVSEENVSLLHYNINGVLDHGSDA